MDRDKVRELKMEINKSLEEIGAEYGMTIKIQGSMSFTESSCRGKFECFETKSDGTVYDPSKEDFINRAKQYGLSPKDLGKTFTHNGELFKITGLKSSRPKFPISAENVVTQKRYKFPASLVKRQLEGGI